MDWDSVTMDSNSVSMETDEEESLVDTSSQEDDDEGYERPVFQKQARPVHLNISYQSRGLESEENNETPSATKKKSKGNDPSAMAVLRRLSPELQHGYRILLDLMSDRCKSFAWPFMDRVDPVLLKLPDYEERITTPMWLTQMEEKFENAEYESISEFVSDMRLMLSNCYRYNGLKHTVSRQGQVLECHFEQKLTQLPRHVREKTYFHLTSPFLDDDEPDISLSSVSGRRRISQRIMESKSNSTPVAEAMVRVIEKEKEERHKQQLIRRKEELHRLNTRLVEWEKEELLAEPIRTQLRSMWEIAAISQFLKLCGEAMFLQDFSICELERALLLPQSSLLLSRVFTNVLTSRYHRKRISKRPPMPYEFWQDKLRKKLDTWFSYLLCEGATTAAVARILYIPERFFQVLGSVNPMTGRQFHDLSLYERVWLLKGLCDHLFETDYDVWFGVDSSLIEDQRPVVLGEDEERFTYLYFPHFNDTDLRIYRQAQIKEPKEERKKRVAEKAVPSPAKRGRKPTKTEAEPKANATPRGRGRPKKVVEPGEETPSGSKDTKMEQQSSDESGKAFSATPGDEKRGRGRPRKYDTPPIMKKEKKERKERKTPVKPTAIVTPVRRSSRMASRATVAEDQPEESKEQDDIEEEDTKQCDVDEAGQRQEAAEMKVLDSVDKLQGLEDQGPNQSDLKEEGREESECGPPKDDPEKMAEEGGVKDEKSAVGNMDCGDKTGSPEPVTSEVSAGTIDRGSLLHVETSPKTNGSLESLLVESGKECAEETGSVKIGDSPNTVLERPSSQESLCNGMIHDPESESDKLPLDDIVCNRTVDTKPIKCESSLNGAVEKLAGAEESVLSEADLKVTPIQQNRQDIKSLCPVSPLNQNQSNNARDPGEEVVNSHVATDGVPGDEVDSKLDLTATSGMPKLKAETQSDGECGKTQSDGECGKIQQDAMVQDATAAVQVKDIDDTAEVASNDTNKDFEAAENSDLEAKVAGKSTKMEAADADENKLDPDMDLVAKPGGSVDVVERPPTPAPQPTPGLSPPEGEFELVCDCVAEFRELIERFAEKEETISKGRKKIVQPIKRPMRVVYLHRTLSEMLEDLESHEPKLLKVIYKAREKIHKEMEAYQKDPSPNQEAAEFWYQIQKPAPAQPATSSAEVSSIDDNFSSTASDNNSELDSEGMSDREDGFSDEEEEEEEDSDVLEEEEVPNATEDVVKVENPEGTGVDGIGAEENKEKLDLYSGVEIAGRTMRSSKRRRAQKRDTVRAQKKAKRSKIQIVKGANLLDRYSQIQKEIDDWDDEDEDEDEEDDEEEEEEEKEDAKFQRVHNELKANLNARTLSGKHSVKAARVESYSAKKQTLKSTSPHAKQFNKETPELNRDGRFIRLLKHTTGSGKPRGSSQSPQTKRATPQDPTLKVPFLNKSAEPKVPEKTSANKKVKTETFSFTIDASVWETLKDKPEERQRMIMEHVQKMRAAEGPKKESQQKLQNSRQSPWFSKNVTKPATQSNLGLSPECAASSFAGKSQAVTVPQSGNNTSSAQLLHMLHKDTSQDKQPPPLKPQVTQKAVPLHDMPALAVAGTEPVGMGTSDMPTLAPFTHKAAQRAASGASALGNRASTSVTYSQMPQPRGVGQTTAPVPSVIPGVAAPSMAPSIAVPALMPGVAAPRATAIVSTPLGASAVAAGVSPIRLSSGHVLTVQPSTMQGPGAGEKTVVLPTNLKVQTNNKHWKIVYVQKPGASKPELCLQQCAADGSSIANPGQNLVPLTNVQTPQQQLQKQPQKPAVQPASPGRSMQIQMVPQSGNKMVMQAVCSPTKAPVAPQLVIQNTARSGQVLGTAVSNPLVQVSPTMQGSGQILGTAVSNPVVQVSPTLQGSGQVSGTTVSNPVVQVSPTMQGSGQILGTAVSSPVVQVSPTMQGSRQVLGTAVSNPLVQVAAPAVQSVGVNNQGPITSNAFPVVIHTKLDNDGKTPSGKGIHRSVVPTNNVILQTVSETGIVPRAPEPSMKQIPVNQESR